MGRRAARLLVWAALASAAASATAWAGDIVLVCYLSYSGSGTTGQFIRRLDIDTKAKTVAIADDLHRNGFRPLGYYGTLVTADDDTIVFDYASPQSSGRTRIDRHTGAVSFSDQRVVGRGTCSPSDL